MTTCAPNMSTVDVFSTPVEYRFKTRWFSISTLVVFIFLIAVIVIPIYLAHQAGGFWLKNRMFVETPTVVFSHKYLLLAERDFDKSPIVCSSFKTYQQNPINDDCSVVKIREIDIDKDRRKDILKFEARFYSDLPVRSIKLLLYFQFQLKEIAEQKFETLATFEYTLPNDVQKVHMIGDLKLNQKGLIRRETFLEIPNNETVELSEYSLEQVLTHNARKKFSAQFTNTHMTWQMGYTNDEPIIISGEAFYLEQLLYYQPSFWEELKWAWIQYFSILTIIAYFVKRILKYFFSKSVLRSYIVTPWKEK